MSCKTRNQKNLTKLPNIISLCAFFLALCELFVLQPNMHDARVSCTLYGMPHSECEIVFFLPCLRFVAFGFFFCRNFHFNYILFCLRSVQIIWIICFVNQRNCEHENKNMQKQNRQKHECGSSKWKKYGSEIQNMWHILVLRTIWYLQYENQLFSHLYRIFFPQCKRMNGEQMCILDSLNAYWCW